jgi:hypothetical protein
VVTDAMLDAGLAALRRTMRDGTPVQDYDGRVLRRIMGEVLAAALDASPPVPSPQPEGDASLLARLLPHVGDAVMRGELLQTRGSQLDQVALAYGVSRRSA